MITFYCIIYRQTPDEKYSGTSQPTSPNSFNIQDTAGSSALDGLFEHFKQIQKSQRWQSKGYIAPP